MPSSILTPAQANSSNVPDNDAAFCGICRRQFSRYTCPRCNLFYCSLSCFRAEAHSQCSEPFYRDQLASDIHAEPSTSAEERKAMMDLLKRFEEDSGNDDPFANPEYDDDEGAGGDDGDGDDLERRLAGIDLGSASPDRIWAVLTPEERARFTRAVHDPGSELAKKLLTSPDLVEDIPVPWWVTLPSTPQANAPTLRPARPPDIMAIPEALLITASTSPSRSPPDFPLAYNLVAILVAYAFASRHLSAYPLSSSSPEAHTLVSRLVPFLIARDDKTRFPGIESATTDIFSRFDEGAITPAALALLLRDAATLLRPPLVAVAEVEGVWECVPALRALSDLHALFKPRSPRTAAKIMFYAAQVHWASSSASFLLRGLQADVERWAMKLEKEEDEKGREAGADHGISMTTTEMRKIVLDRPSPNERPSIIEL